MMQWFLEQLSILESLSNCFWVRLFFFCVCYKGKEKKAPLGTHVRKGPLVQHIKSSSIFTATRGK